MRNRNVLALLSLLLAAMMVFTACASETPAVTTPAETKEASESTTTAATPDESKDYSDRLLRVCYSGIAETMNPFEAANSIPHSATFEQVYISLMRRDDNHEIDYSLADHYDVTEDGKEYTFHIRSDATFANGDKITAEDVKFSYDGCRTSN